MVNFVIFYDHLEYFTAIAYILQPFGLVCGPLVYFPNLECLDQEKSGNPGTDLVLIITRNSAPNTFFRSKQTTYTSISLATEEKNWGNQPLRPSHRLQIPRCSPAKRLITK
jgi:hypothetical protein